MPPPLSAYELQRQVNIARNKAKLRILGLDPPQSASTTRRGTKGTKRRRSSSASSSASRAKQNSPKRAGGPSRRSSRLAGRWERHVSLGGEGGSNETVRRNASRVCNMDNGMGESDDGSGAGAGGKRGERPRPRGKRGVSAKKHSKSGGQAGDSDVGAFEQWQEDHPNVGLDIIIQERRSYDNVWSGPVLGSCDIRRQTNQAVCINSDGICVNSGLKEFMKGLKIVQRTGQASKKFGSHAWVVLADAAAVCDAWAAWKESGWGSSS